jgi:hypothetical protein
MTFLNTKDVGPIVIEVPPAVADGSLNANFVNVWQMPLEDAGLLGVDKGKGVKLLMLPPGYKEQVPKGYTPLQPGTWGSYALIRSNLKSRSDADLAKSVAYAKQLKVYPLSQAANVPETKFTDVKEIDFDSTIKHDASFFDNLNRMVQNEPWLDRDRAMIQSLVTLGIEKGKPFNPDTKTQKILNDAIKEADAYLEMKYDAGFPPYWPDLRWMFPSYPSFISVVQESYTDSDHYPLDERAVIYRMAFIGLKRMGVGQFYLVNIRDKDNNTFEGGKTYTLHVPPNVPVDQYWSLTAYDRQTHALIKNLDRASRGSNAADMQKNTDGSVDLYIGPKAPAGKESNWIPTDPKRQFELMFRLYGPTKAFFYKEWKLPDVELVK